jgi:short subunit dehydrogenase-like uncharacterized protein
MRRSWCRLKPEAIMDWMIYGANGYTGELIAREAKKRGAVRFLLAETR